MNRLDYERAAALFHQVWDRHAASTYAPDAPYWEAFNLYRTDETENLERALAALEVQRERYAKAPTRENGDARALEARIRGIMARRGDEEAAQQVVVAANEIAAMSQAIGEQVTAHAGAIAEAVSEAMSEQGRAIAEQMARVAEETAAIGRGISGSGDSEIPEQCRAPRGLPDR
jgi:hypothetical protein